MDGMVDAGSPRRQGSLSSLHRLSSGSFSHNKSLTPSSGNLQPSGQHQLASSPLNSQHQTNSNMCKDLDKFTRQFILKSIQVIVQSRISANKKLKTECKPNGNDWFNINIADYADIGERTKAAIDLAPAGNLATAANSSPNSRLSVTSNWQVCCEISLKANEIEPLVLEHWIITNRVHNTHHHPPSSSAARTLFTNNPTLQSPKSHHQMATNHQRSPPLHNLTTSSHTNGTSPNSHHSGNRARSTTLGSTVTSPTSIRTRTRLNSIDDCSSGAAADEKLLVTDNVGLNFNDVKSSASCFSLSTTATSINQHTLDQNTPTINTSPSIGSLANIHTPPGASSTAITPQSPRTSAMSSIYTIYNRMSLLLKTLMTTTHIVPAHWIASKAQQTDSCVFSYRIYTHPSSQESMKTRGSLEDIVPNVISGSPGKRETPLNISFTSLNIKDLVPFDELDQFCPLLKLGSIKSEFSELDVSFCYRTDMKNSTHFMKSPRLTDTYNKMFDDDCITAAKQLLACNDSSLPISNPNQTQRLDNDAHDGFSLVDRPLQPAFATPRKLDTTNQDASLSIIESAFDGILNINNNTTDSEATYLNSHEVRKLDKLCISSTKKLQSEPIQVPTDRSQVKSALTHQNISSGSTPKSLTDSFVFVDLNPPFASEESCDISTFFHGPTPAFSSSFESPKDVDELTNQLANIESNASQFDEFVDNICLSEGEVDGD